MDEMAPANFPVPCAVPTPKLLNRVEKLSAGNAFNPDQIILKLNRIMTIPIVII